MGTGAIVIGVLLLIIAAGLVVVKGVYTKGNVNKAKQAYREAKRGGRMREDAPDESTFVAEYQESHAWPVPGLVNVGVLVLAIAAFGVGTFNKIFFYAEPGFVYHVRTITGDEGVVDKTGYAMYLFGRYEPWKKAMTVQAGSEAAEKDSMQAELNTTGNSATTSANLPALNVVMLDQVDSRLSATARFRIPTDEDTFLKMAHEYRTPANLLRTALVPAFKETLQATGSLMAAEEYFSGRRTEFNAEFENQMGEGIYLVTRHQVSVDDPTATANATADGSTGAGNVSVTTGDDTKVKWVVEKKMAGGVPVRKKQAFTNYGITVIEARVTDLKPNEAFTERMKLKQQAAADRAIAQEKRVQEEEQRLLAIAKGEREVAERQAEAKQKQITATTEAETTKRLALIEAGRRLEEAEIEKQTAALQLERDQIRAESIQVLADADKYERQARIEGDNALQQKLDAEVQIQAEWAKAYAARKVPAQVFMSGAAAGGEAGVPTGADGEVSTFMNILTMDAAKRLAYDRGVPATVDTK